MPGRKGRAADILERTYKDRLTVTRKTAVEDKETGETMFRDTAVYGDIPCALSSSGNTAPEQNGNHQRRKDEMVLFAGPGYFLQAGDRVNIRTEAGQEITGESGRTFTYPDHGETPIKVEKIV